MRRWHTQWLVGVVIAGAMLMSARNGHTQSADLDRAREYFQAGAQAYAVGEYAAAIQAFEQAYHLVPRAAVLFSIAQAERKLYFLDHDPAHLSRSIDLYRQYLEQDPRGARKGDAVQALSELEPLVARTPTTPPPATSAPIPMATPAPTRVMITSSTPDAQIALDSNEEVVSPLIREVEPGEHLVRVMAPGFVESTRKIIAVKGDLVTVDVALTERPARLVVIARDGALLSIDGRVQGECPFPKPIELAAGSHLITLSASGYVGLSTERTLVRGETTVVRAPMPRTLQRTSALISLGAGASAVTAGVVFALLAHQQDDAARGYLNARGRQELSSVDLEQYNSAHRDRDKLGTAALVSFSVGVGLALTGAALLAFDPGAIRYKPTSDKQISRDPLARPSLFASPALAPGLLGLSLSTSF